MKPHMRAIVGFLDEIGATDVAIVNGGKHPRVVFWYGGREHQRIISGTPTNKDEAAWRANRRYPPVSRPGRARKANWGAASSPSTCASTPTRSLAPIRRAGCRAAIRTRSDAAHRHVFWRPSLLGHSKARRGATWRFRSKRCFSRTPRMIVRLTQIDGKLPNLALMRLAAWHRGRGDEVCFSRSPYRELDEPAYDRVYGSAIFAFSAERVARLRQSFPGAIVGGTWNLPPNGVEPLTIERFDHSIPDALDYSDYPGFTASIGFTQRGCRLKCRFCVVPRMEGKPVSVGSIADLWRGPGHPKHLHLLDNDFFGQPAEEWRARFREIRDGGFKVCFSQGFNIRLVDDAGAAELASIDYRDDNFDRRRLHTAWDNLKDERIFFRGVDILRRAGIPPSHLMVYMLVGFDPAETWERVLYRFHRMFDLGMRPYPMIFKPDWNRTLPLGAANPRITARRLTLKHFQRWAIRPSKLGIPFHEYDAAAKGWSGADQGNLFSEAA